MDLDYIIRNFAELSGDAIGVGYRRPGEDWARLCWVNAQFTKLFGFELDEVVGHRVGRMLDDAHLDEFVVQLRQEAQFGRNLLSLEGFCRRKDETTFWASILVRYFEEDESGGRYSVAVYRDISRIAERERAASAALAERQAMLDEITSAKERLDVAINALPGPLAIWDANHRLVICNRAFAPRLLGQEEPPRPGTPVEDVLRVALERGRFSEAIGDEEVWLGNSLAALKTGPIHERTVYSDGKVFLAESMYAASGDLVVLATDITEQEQQRTKLEAYARQLEEVNNEVSFNALHDTLTGLGNRRMLSESLTQAVEWRRLSGGDLAVLHIDLDRFKQINDTMGHAQGDAVLSAVADRLREVAQPDDVIARMGGDEFVILIRLHPGEDRLPRLASEVLDALSYPVFVEGRAVRIGASVGVARTPLSSEEELVTNADIALYQAKGAGRGQIRRFDERHLTEMTEMKRLADDLMRGLENDEIVPFFQPQVDAGTGEIVALEALARWDHPDRGVLTPDQFLGIADDLNLISEIDSIVFEKALSLRNEHLLGERFGDVGIAFNVSDKRLMGEDILVGARQSESANCSVAFELLETIYFEEETDAFLYRIDALRETGVTIEVDDFGSGRASIVALERIAPDRLKIDRRLVAPITESEKSRNLVRSIVEIGHILGIGITAEGAETAEHAAVLRDLGCDRLQGYHFARPMALRELLAAMGFTSNKRASA